MVYLENIDPIEILKEKMKYKTFVLPTFHFTMKNIAIRPYY